MIVLGFFGLVLASALGQDALARRLQQPSHGDINEGLEGAITCPDSGNYTGDSNYIGKGPMAAPLRGAVACVDNPITVTAAGRTQVAALIYGPMENGFTTDQLRMFFLCTADEGIQGGIDTGLAEEIAEYVCNQTEDELSILDSCGGHALPYHYHEKMTCLYTNSSNGHSTRIGTALDGRGIYGKYIEGGVLPDDLDACGGRYGTPPDLENTTEEVYYYMVQDNPPFTIGCFGPATLEECRALYDTCGDGDDVTVTTASGNIAYDLDCPCYNTTTGSNVASVSGGLVPASTPSSSAPLRATPMLFVSVLVYFTK
uniref:YHYH domain-containing protein n=1 Tax=Mucochytrium quahogii TaxID=96639 RepID=A0A7S2RQQ2_9STRA|mmetsp:Transcript_13231/g.21520  ORF Transcript_13231/g.21520 Transcript_13231/m.21520 type:complete len:314 (+) Transcript_13231:101-1042(+)|eukprot:CAMPEP_0203755926 /NCGR_PEP_ID=MMETSP0098-20131031/9270_1 /ASSEMBLY_ACC=CAM_ASM_000208 /TAXON_ID=96639 /ORGANISM=" , Strain NY0313808BC1" /LENGTH=313 /DNA_ID=CAMNT_0050647565 /DNA_START=54 /DNA_END=995 /DNA_ORIENTATION=-